MLILSDFKLMIKYATFDTEEYIECFFITTEDYYTIMNLINDANVWNKNSYQWDVEQTIKHGYAGCHADSLTGRGLVKFREYLKKTTQINNNVENLLK